MANNKRDYYEVLGVSKTADDAEIKKSFMYDYILVKINSESSLVEDSN